ncbi:TIR domain-containing protein [Sphingomonas sp.]|uniref:TIR domain-containing protein n=1 Tax=Sphingomonas sp. TaxID=28214 RepID=UPI00286AD8C1|nr:TIR domain-containing protein [Sphingomonas sp.]
MANVFLSYAREDEAAAKQLAEGIGGAGHEVWWDRHIQGGSRFSTEIDRALKSAEAVVVLWSPASVESAWVQDEAAEGRDSGRLVPVSLAGTRPPLGFRQFHTVELGKFNGAAGELNDLLDAISKTAGSKASETAASQAAEHKASRGASVCVLPFINMSGDPEQEYFSDGITEDIITDLSKVSALLVIARNTAFTFKGRVMDVKEVARSLDVTHVLEGSVRKVGSRVRITAQLIDSATGGHVWADRYDRDLTDIFAIQDEISKAIVAALRVKLLPEEKKAIETRGTASVEAYNLYLMARQQWTDGGIGDVRRQETIVRICNQATTFDPNYAQAWGLMALAQSQLRFWHGRDVDPEPAVERALSINPDLAEAHCVRAHLLEEQGHQAEATAEIETAVRLDPDSWEVNREAARLIFRQHRAVDAIPFFEKAAALMESDWHNPSMLITCYRGTGDAVQLKRVAQLTVERTERAIARDPSNAAVLACGAGALAIIGEDQRARDWIDRALLLDPDNGPMRYNLACALTAGLKDFDRALDVLGPFFEQVDSTTHIRHLEADSDFELLRDDPRFKQMLSDAKERLGLAG